MKKLLWLVMLISSLSAAALAATEDYIAVDIEVFRSWGVLNWGAWQTLDARFVTSRMQPIPVSDAQDVAEAVALCAGTSGGDAAACQLATTLDHTAHWAYALTPQLGKAYRVVLRNLTDVTIGVVLGVDGLNSNGNEPVAGNVSDRKWVLLPGQTVRIGGWQVSEDEALQFGFATPSRTHSPLTEAHGGIIVHVFLPNPLGTAGVKGTEAGAVIGQPTVRIPFGSLTSAPVETVSFDYSTDSVRLGILCTETDGPGIRIVSVIDGTIAAVKGLRAGDVITYANARPINACSDLADLLATRSPGDRIVVKVHRAERVFLATLELGT